MNARIERILSRKLVASLALLAAGSIFGCSDSPEAQVADSQVSANNPVEVADKQLETAPLPPANLPAVDFSPGTGPDLLEPEDLASSVATAPHQTEASAADDPDSSTSDTPTTPAEPESSPTADSIPTATTVADAMKLLDLRKLPRLPDSKPTADTPTQVSLTVKATVAEAEKFYTDLLEKDGWSLVPPEIAVPESADYAQLNFMKQGFDLGVSLYKSLDTGLLSVGLNNYGNIDARKLPQPATAEPLFSNFNTAMYVSNAKVPVVADACLEQLKSAGWQLYNRPFSTTNETAEQRSLTLKQNGVALSAYIAIAPAQMNRTTIQYSVHMLGDELPVPADAAKIEFMDSPLQLTCETATEIPATLEFYRQELAARGWQEKGAGNQQPSEAISVFQRMEGLPVVLKITRLGEDAPTSVSIAEFEMPREVPVESLTDNSDQKPMRDTPVPEGDDSLLSGALASLPTYEEWLKKNKYKPGIERLEQYAAEMEKIANSLGEVPADPEEPPTVDSAAKDAPAKSLPDESEPMAAKSAAASAAAIAAIESAEGRVQTNDDEILTFVELSSKAFGDKQMKLLADMSEITYLNLSFTQVTDQGLAVVADMPKLEKLYLSGLKISDAGLKVVAGLTQLDLLIVSQTPLTDAALGHLKNLANLERLSLQETKITDKGLASLLALPKLKALDLASTNITDAAIPQLVQLRTLEELNLFGTKISPAGVKTLQVALPECDINN